MTLELSEIEGRVLALLLGRAGDEFSNHGCNDFNVAEELHLGDASAKEATRALLEKMVANGVANREELESNGTFLIDWQLFRHFEKLVRGQLSREK